MLGLDIETYSRRSIGHGAAAYAADPSTGVHCAVFGMARAPGEAVQTHIWLPGRDLPAWVVRHITSGGLLLAHNVSFEMSLWQHVLHPHHGWPEMGPLDRWRDTAALAAARALPVALESLTQVLGCQELKDAEGKQLMLTLCKPGADGVIPEPDPLQLERLVDYCAQDVLAMIDCYHRLPALPPSEQEVLVADWAINLRGVTVDLAMAQAMARLQRLRAQKLDHDVLDTTSDLLTVTAVPALRDWLLARGVALPTQRRQRQDGSSPSTVTLSRPVVAKLAADPETPGDVRAVLEARLEASRTTSLAKLARLPSMVSADRRLRWTLRYGGAHTGRWSSSGVQLHNLPKSRLQDREEGFRAAVLAGDLAAAQAQCADVLQGLSWMLRGLFCAAPGYDLIGADYSAIEARVLPWLAGQDDVLALFAAGQDVYMHDARALGSANRQLGKVARLGLGYGMGPVKWVAAAAGFGVTLAPKEARAGAIRWRKANPAIVAFWRQLQDAMIEVIRGKREVRVGRLVVKGGMDCARIRLPSGRHLHYWLPAVGEVDRRIETYDEEGNLRRETVRMTEIRFTKATKGTGFSESTYGGKLAENVTQAVARDLLGHALVQLRRHGGYPVVLHVHDSIVAEVPTGAGDVAEFCRLITTPPAWAQDCPLAAEGYRSPYFRG